MIVVQIAAATLLGDPYAYWPTMRATTGEET
jgi:hypothetical protein